MLLAALQMPPGPYIWTLNGTVLSGVVGSDETNNAQEPNVIYEGSPQILAGPNVFKMWYTNGWASPGICYAESADGISWTKYASNPVLNSFMRSFVFKDGSTYHLYAVPSGTTTRFDHYTSTDGLAWTLSASSVIAVGAGGAWDDEMMGNICVWKETTNDWRAIYESRKAADHIWHLGYATSSDGDTWSKSGSNPVISETGSTGGPYVYKRGTSDYWMWLHHSLSGGLPTDLERYKSTNLTSWTKDPINNILTRGPGDGNASANGQVADPTLLEQGGQTYMWYGANADGSQASGHSTIKLAISRLTMTQLAMTVEGP